MSNLRKLICDNCGGHIDKYSLTCLSCGTQYQKEEQYPEVLRIVTERARTELLQCSVLIPDEFLYLDDKQAIEYAVNEMSRRFSTKLLPFIELEMSKRIATCETALDGRLRVVYPNKSSLGGLINGKEETT